MKYLNLLLSALLIAGMTLIVSCEKDDDNKDGTENNGGGNDNGGGDTGTNNVLSINDTDHALTGASLGYIGSTGTYTHFLFIHDDGFVELTGNGPSGNGSGVELYIKTLANGSSELTTGTYTYKQENAGDGEFIGGSAFKTGDGYAKVDFVVGGTVTITKTGDNYKFTFDLSILDSVDQTTSNLTGTFELAITQWTS